MQRSRRGLLWGTMLGFLCAIAATVVASAAAQAQSSTQPASRSARPQQTPSGSEPGLSLGLSGAVSQLTAGTSQSVAAWDHRAHAVGARIIRLNITWASVAPTTDPAGFDAADPNSPDYDWSAVDAQVRQLTSEGFTILLEVGGAPSWAQAPGAPADATPGSWEPNATDFGQFATALATRYDGKTVADGTALPRISDWQAWNEPNLTENLAPQWVSVNGNETAESPTIYRNLDNAFYAAVKRVDASNFVVGAGTAPYGDPPGGQRMAPVTFDQYLFCLNAEDERGGACPGPTHMNAIDDHPYVSGLCCLPPTWHASYPGDTSIADMYKIVKVLKAAQGAHTILPARGTAVWATEIGWNTDPPNPNPSEASPPAQVAKWATQALYILWSQGVDTVLWYQLADDPESVDGWDATYTEGLYYVDGQAKPAAAAFAFPFMTNRKTITAVQAWGRSPRAGIVHIQHLIAGGWKTVASEKVAAGQVFVARLQQITAATYRAEVAGLQSPDWVQAP